jgi:hypothetical protein
MTKHKTITYYQTITKDNFDKINNMIEELEQIHFNSQNNAEKQKIELITESLFYIKKQGLLNATSLSKQTLEEAEEEKKLLENKLRLIDKKIEVIKIVKDMIIKK